MARKQLDVFIRVSVGEDGKVKLIFELGGCKTSVLPNQDSIGFDAGKLSDIQIKRIWGDNGTVDLPEENGRMFYELMEATGCCMLKSMLFGSELELCFWSRVKAMSLLPKMIEIIMRDILTPCCDVVVYVNDIQVAQAVWSRKKLKWPDGADLGSKDWAGAFHDLRGDSRSSMDVNSEFAKLIKEEFEEMSKDDEDTGCRRGLNAGYYPDEEY